MELATLAQEVAELLARGMGPRSLFNLHVALNAVQRDGVGGMLAIQLPTRPKGHVECLYTMGSEIELSMRWSNKAA